MCNIIKKLKIVGKRKIKKVSHVGISINFIVFGKLKDRGTHLLL